MAETLLKLASVLFALSGVSLAVSVFFWFFFGIPAVVGDLTGRTARKSIARMRDANERSGVKPYRSSKVNAGRGRVTDRWGKETETLALQGTAPLHSDAKWVMMEDIMLVHTGEEIF